MQPGTKTCACGGHGCLICNFTGIVPDLDGDADQSPREETESGRRNSSGPDDFFTFDDNGNVDESPTL